MFSLIALFCTATTCEEYIVDYNLTRNDCIERYVEETNDSKSASMDVLYKEAVERYNTVEMIGKVEHAGFTCVKS